MNGTSIHRLSFLSAETVGMEDMWYIYGCTSTIHPESSTESLSSPLNVHAVRTMVRNDSETERDREGQKQRRKR